METEAALQMLMMMGWANSSTRLDRCRKKDAISASWASISRAKMMDMITWKESWRESVMDGSALSVLLSRLRGSKNRLCSEAKLS